MKDADIGGIPEKERLAAGFTGRLRGDVRVGAGPRIQHRCLVMSEGYIRSHYAEIKQFANTIENRGDDEDCTMESLLRDNGEVMAMCRKFGAEMLLIDGEYRVDLDW